MTIFKPLGYFLAFLLCYLVTTSTVGTLMLVFGVPLGESVFLVSGIFTVILAIIAAVMHDNNTIQIEETERSRIAADHNYRMGLLKVAEEEAKNKGELESFSNR